MLVNQVTLPAGLLGTALALLLFVPTGLLGHCDTMDGPVVAAARKALTAGSVTPVLKWVKPEAEPEITAAFNHALAVRRKGGEAQKLADRYFFETLVRVHRAGEGAPYTGLSDEPVEPIIQRSDAAITGGSDGELVAMLNKALSAAVQQKFARVLATARDAETSVAAGREYVEAYVDFTHFVERLHNDIAASGGHANEPPAHEE